MTLELKTTKTTITCHNRMLPPHHIHTSNTSPTNHIQQTTRHIVTKSEIKEAYEEILKDMLMIEMTMKRIVNKVSNDTDNRKKEIVLDYILDNSISDNLRIMEEYERVITNMIDNNIMPE